MDQLSDAPTRTALQRVASELAGVDKRLAELAQPAKVYTVLPRPPRAIHVLPRGDVQKPGSIPEEKLRQEYEQRKEEFEVPERREVQQILAPSEEKAKEAEAALAAGKDWKEVAMTAADGTANVSGIRCPAATA